MRRLYFLAGLAVVGLGLAGWATLTTAQPSDRDDEAVAPQPDLLKGRAVSQPIPMPRAPEEPGRLPPVTGTPTEPEPLLLPPAKPPAPKREPAANPLDKAPGSAVVAPQEPAVPDPARVTDEPSKPTGPASAMPGSRQDAAVCLEWHGLAAAKIGQPADYALHVRNTCAIPVQKVVVQVRVPDGMRALSTEPKAEAAESVLLWELGTLAAREDRWLKLKLVSTLKGDLPCQAWVTFTGSTVMRVQVREPKLAVKANAPKSVMIGETTEFEFVVTNPGDHPAEKARITVTLDGGLESARGNKLSYELGNIQPGATRCLKVPCVAKAGGEQRCEAVVDGDGGLKAADAATITVTQPKLDLEVQGPKLRYLERKAVYTFKVTNPGDAPAGNVFVSEVLPAGFKFVAADGGGQHDPSTRQVKWYVGDLGPGQSKEIKLELMAVNAGDHMHKVMAAGSRGVRAERELATKVEGLSAILMELVDVDDPVEVGSETAYEIRITNTGSKVETEIKLLCSVPPQFEVKTAQGPVKFQQEGSEVVFDVLPQLAPRADVTYKVMVKAKTKGDARFKAQLTTSSLVEPVVKVESTRVYDD